MRALDELEAATRKFSAALAADDIAFANYEVALETLAATARVRMDAAASLVSIHLRDGHTYAAVRFMRYQRRDRKP